MWERTVKSKMNKAIIFDLDGTLLDTLEDIAISANYALNELGFVQEPTDKFRYFAGEGVVKLFENIFSSNPQSQETIQKAVHLFETHYAMQFSQNTKLFEGISKMLSFLQKKGYKMAILSNKPDSFTKMCVFKYLRKWNFQRVYGQREGIARKPHPDGALDIAKALHVKPQECFFVGDTCIDMLTATQAGMIAVGVLWGFRDKEELLQNGAQHIVQSPQEAIKLFA